MKVIIAGSRWIKDYDQVVAAVTMSGLAITEVVSGGAPGPDKLGERFARQNGLAVKLFHAQWRDRDGSFNYHAGFQRNTQMAEYADALIALWDGRSSGTKHMIDEAHRVHLTVYVHSVRPVMRHRVFPGDEL